MHLLVGTGVDFLSPILIYRFNDGGGSGGDSSITSTTVGKGGVIGDSPNYSGINAWSGSYGSGGGGGGSINGTSFTNSTSGRGTNGIVIIWAPYI